MHVWALDLIESAHDCVGSTYPCVKMKLKQWYGSHVTLLTIDTLSYILQHNFTYIYIYEIRW